jgi:hypothetical protein
MPRGLILFYILTCLTSCAKWQQPDIIEPVKLIPLAAPLGPSRRIVQQISAIWANKQGVLLCVIELNKQRIAIAGLSLDGLSLFNLSYDGKDLSLKKSPLLPTAFAPEFIIKDLQLAYWPLANLQKTMPTPWHIEANPSHRHLYFNNQLISDVEYLQPDAAWPRSIALSNHQFHYKLLIKTISYEALPE